MSAMASKITNNWTVCFAVCIVQQLKKHQCSPFLTVWEGNFPHKGRRMHMWWRHHITGRTLRPEIIEVSNCGPALCGNQKLSDQQFPRTTVPVMQKRSRVISQLFDSFPGKQCRADSRLAPSQRETSLQSNAVSHWLGANLLVESALQWVLGL